MSKLPKSIHDTMKLYIKIFVNKVLLKEINNEIYKELNHLNKTWERNQKEEIWKTIDRWSEEMDSN